MNNAGLTWVIASLFVAVGVVLLAMGFIEGTSLLYAALGVIVVGSLGQAIKTKVDAKWLPSVVVGAYLAKLIASFARFGVLEFIYGGRGDATGYHGSGHELVGLWRSFEIPHIEIGTQFVNAATAFLYIPYVPTFLGGFFIFASLAFFGQTRQLS